MHSFFINSLCGGGAERVVSTLFNEFVKDNECYVVLMENEISYALDERIKIICLNENPNISGIIKFIR
nr:glycosyltransferase [Campylobacter sp.]